MQIYGQKMLRYLQNIWEISAEILKNICLDMLKYAEKYGEISVQLWEKYGEISA